MAQQDSPGGGQTWKAAGAPVWMPRRIRRLAGDRYVDHVAEFQVVTRGWNRVVGMPYLVHLPEKDRVLMLVYLDYHPCKAAVMFSDDHGTTWSKPALVPQAEDERCLGTNLMYLGGGTVMFCDERNRWFSHDYGQSWPEKTPVQADAGGRPWAGWQWEPGLVDRDAATGQVLRLAETAYSHNGDDYPKPGYFSQAYLRFSYDAGRTWEPDITVPEWRQVNEVALCRAANRNLVAYCRTDVKQWYRDPAHRPDGLHEPDLYSGFGVSISRDDGRTWSQVRELFDYGRHFGSMAVLPGGEIVMTYVVRIGYPCNADGFPQYGIEAVVSRDHGETWDLEHRLILDEWTGNLRGHNAWWSSPQSTSTVLLPDGSLLTAYGRAADCLPTDGGKIGPPRDIGLLRWTP